MGTITVENFATIPGGVAFVWVLMALLDRTFIVVPTAYKIALQSLLSLAWALLAVILFLDTGPKESAQQVVIMWFSVMAAQGFGYKTIEALLRYRKVPDALDVPDAAEGKRPAWVTPASATVTPGVYTPGEPAWVSATGTPVHWVLPPNESGSTTAAALTNTVVLNAPPPESLAQQEWRRMLEANAAPSSASVVTPFAPYGDQGTPEGRI